MASTYSTNLALELIGTGDQSGTWGTTTNTNLGTLIEQAISGYITQTITDGADTTITIPNGATGVARNMYIEMTGTLTAARNLIVPANKKLYFVYNNTTGGYAVTVKVSGQTGVSVPNGAKILLVSNGTDIVSATNYIASLTVGSITLSSALGAASGGTGIASYTVGDLLYASGTTTLSKLADVATGNALISGGVGVAPAWGKVGLTTHVSGTLPVANGGTGAATLTANNVLLGNGTSALQEVAPGTSGNVLTSNGTTWTSAAPATGGSLTGVQVYTSGANTWTKPAGLVRVMVVVVGAGGGGAGRDDAVGMSGGGGGSGGYTQKLIAAASLGATETATVGSGGTASANGSSPANGNSGGTSSFGSHCSATGGGGGAGSISTASRTPGSGGAGSSGDLNASGGDAGWATYDAGAYVSSLYGPLYGAASFFGGVSRTGAGKNYGAGGAGGSVNASGGGTSGGAGANGVIIVYEYTS